MVFRMTLEIRERLRAVLKKNIDYGYHFINCSFLGDYIADEEMFKGWYERDEEELINESVKEIEKVIYEQKQQKSPADSQKKGLEFIQSIRKKIGGQQFRDRKLLHLRTPISLEGNASRTLET